MNSKTKLPVAAGAVARAVGDSSELVFELLLVAATFFAAVGPLIGD